jgi:hypothetical protein
LLQNDATERDRSYWEIDSFFEFKSTLDSSLGEMLHIR